jgi:hypothetical protein
MNSFKVIVALNAFMSRKSRNSNRAICSQAMRHSDGLMNPRWMPLLCRRVYFLNNADGLCLTDPKKLQTFLAKSESL